MRENAEFPEPCLAVVGVGAWGRNLVRNFHALGVLKTICDTDPATRESVLSQYPGLRKASDYAALLADSEVKCVAIATPAAGHYKLARQALMAGKDVYVEKPLCLDLAQAEDLIRLAADSGRILMVGHLLQYHPSVIRLQELVRAGELGKIYYITSNRLNLGKIRREENALWSFAPHDISVILSLVGHQLPEQVLCTGGDYLSHQIADVTLTSLRFPGGVRSHIYVSWLNPFKEQKLTVFGSEGLAVFDDTRPWKEKLAVYRSPVTWTEGVDPIPNKAEPELMASEEKEPLREECLHFLHCCRHRTKPKTDGLEGLRVLRILEAAQRSLDREGAIVDLKTGRGKEAGSEYFAHPTAVIDEGAAIGRGTKVWHFSHLMKDCEIGERCSLGQNVFVGSQVRLGRNVKVQNNVSLYTGVVCEDEVFLGPSMVFTNVVNPRSAISRRGEYQTTLVRRGATIGANATVVCGHELGEYSFVGAGSVVTRDVKPHALMVGNPARQIGWMSKAGQRLELPLRVAAGEACEAVCPLGGEAYRLAGDRLEVIEEKGSGG